MTAGIDAEEEWMVQALLGARAYLGTLAQQLRHQTARTRVGNLREAALLDEIRPVSQQGELVRIDVLVKTGEEQALASTE